MGSSNSTKHQRFFVSFWALAHVFHYSWGFLAFYWLQGQEHLSDPLSLLLYGIVSCSALLLLSAPGSGAMLLTMSALQVLEVAWSSPDVPNHWLLTAMVNLSLLLHRALYRETWYQPFLQSVRIGVPCFYGFAAFWKMNSDFLDPAVSCATHFSNYVFSNCCGFHTQSPLVPYGTLLTEMALPLLLVIRRTRYAGILLGCVFHLGLGIHLLKQFLNFSSVMMALLFAFVPAETSLSLPKALERNRFMALLCLLLMLLTLTGCINAITWLIGRFALWLAYGLVLTFGIAQTALKAPRPESILTNWHAVSLALPLLIILNGSTPIFGLKTHSAWQMYGNLSITHTGSNHLLLPYSLDVFGFIEEPERVKTHSFIEQKLYRVKPQTPDECSW